jgi:hypothetical protein
MQMMAEPGYVFFGLGVKRNDVSGIDVKFFPGFIPGKLF